MTTLLFDGYRPGDSALENSHWMAERTRDALGDESAMLSHPDATRANLEASLGEATIRGLVAFGHGDGGIIYGAMRRQHRRDGAVEDSSDESGDAPGRTYLLREVSDTGAV